MAADWAQDCRHLHWGVPGHWRSTGAARHDRARSDFRLRERRLMSGGYARRPPADRW